MLFIFSTLVAIRYLWQLKTNCFPALVSNTCCSLYTSVTAYLMPAPLEKSKTPENEWQKSKEEKSSKN